jgi:hypothetical protein
MFVIRMIHSLGRGPDCNIGAKEVDLQIILGSALIATNGWPAPEPGDAYARAHQLCEQLDRLALLGAGFARDRSRRHSL